MSSTLLRRGRIRTSQGIVSAMAVEDGRVAWLGDDERAASYDGADTVVDLAGALVTPAFVDAHVHVVETGESLAGPDLSAATGPDDCLRLVADHLDGMGADDVVIAHGWDETTWADPRHPTADDLERVAPRRLVLLDRVDGHSAVFSHSLLARVPGVPALDGYSPDGLLQRDASRAVFAELSSLVTREQRLRAARRAMATMASRGIAGFHENGGNVRAEIGIVQRAAREAGLHATYYWGRPEAYDVLDEPGVAGLAGDLVADGALGSRSAALTEPYADTPGHRGSLYVDPELVARHVAGCTRRGAQAGFHCIGDAAIDTVTEGFRRAADGLGPDAVRRCRHRLEHVEMPSPAATATMAELGIVASMQPMFDGTWGGPDRMYAVRLGDRWRTLNPFRTLVDAGVRLAFGSDSPVTPLDDPWAGVGAAVHHRTDGLGLTPGEAFAAHTTGGWYAARVDDAGEIAVGAPATYAVWRAGDLGADDLPDLSPGAELPECLRTVVAGRSVFDANSSDTGSEETP